MSHTYQTSAKRRDRREDDSERRSSSRNSSQVPSGLSKTSSRTHDGAATPRSIWPASPAMVWQRNKAVDASRPTDSVLTSPKSMHASMAKTVPDPSSVDNATDASTPTNLVKVLGSRRSTESARASNASIGSNTNNPDTQGSTASSDLSALSRTRSDRPDEEPPRFYPPSQSPTLSQSGVAQMQPRISDPVGEWSGARDPRPSRIPVQSTRSSQLERQSHQLPTEVADGPHVRDYQPPNTTTPAISPPQSPRMMYHDGYGGQQPQYPYYPPPMPPGFYQQPGFFPPTSIPQSPDIRSPDFENKVEHQRVVAKVTSVLPDINRLLEHYQQTQGQVSTIGSIAKQTEVQHTEEVAHLRLELSTRKEEYEKLIERVASENYTYKHKVEEQAKRIAELIAGARSTSSSQENVASLKKRGADAIAAAESALCAKKELSSEKLKLEADIERLKISHDENLQAKDRDHHNAANEHKHVLSKLHMELANLTTKHSQQTIDLESCRTMHKALQQKLDLQARANEAAVAALKAAMSTKSSEAEDLARQHRQQMESQLASLTSQRLLELQAVRDAHERTIKDVQAEHQAKSTKMLGEHQTSIQATQDTHEQILKDVRAEHQSHVVKATKEHQTAVQAMREELTAHQEAFGKLATEHEHMGSTHSQLVEAVTSWKTRHDASEAETVKLKGFLETLGPSERSKNDATYTDAFEALVETVESFCTQYFSSTPAGSAIELSTVLEPNMPDVFGSTKVARELRSTMVQHKIFTILQKRVFGCMMLGSLEDHWTADIEGLLSMLSHKIRRKSKRREALWRSITLRALYSGSDAKAGQSLLASSVLDEIVDHTEALAGIGSGVALREALGIIVKSSIELWRQCLIETDRICCTLPDISSKELLSDVILWVTPRVERSSIGPPATWGQLNSKMGESSVLLQGTALRQDSPLVLKRYEELSWRRVL